MRPNVIPAIAASNKRRNETKKMSSRKLNEHVEEELFNKEKRVTPKPPQSEPKIIKEGKQPKKPTPPKTQVIKEGEDPTPVKKKKPYYRKKYNKPTPVEVVIPEPVNTEKYFIHGLVTGIVVTTIIGLLIWFFNQYVGIWFININWTRDNILVIYYGNTFHQNY